MQPLHYRCEECNTVYPASKQLVAPNPWDADAPALRGCPVCYAADSHRRVCDEPKCTAEVSCGWLTPSGGCRMTCAKHRQVDTIAAPPQGE